MFFVVVQPTAPGISITLLNNISLALGRGDVGAKGVLYCTLGLAVCAAGDTSGGVGASGEP